MSDFEKEKRLSKRMQEYVHQLISDTESLKHRQVWKAFSLERKCKHLGNWKVKNIYWKFKYKKARKFSPGIS